MSPKEDVPLLNLFLQQTELFAQQKLFMQDLLEILKGFTDASACSIRLIEDDILTVGVNLGFSSDNGWNRPITVNKRLQKWLKNPSPMMISDIGTTKEITKKQKEKFIHEGFKSFVFIPLQEESGQVLGILLLFYKRINEIKPAQMRMLQLYAKMFSYILYRSVLYEDIMELKQLLQSVIDFTTDATVITDELGKILYVSKQASRLFHKKISSLLGRYIFLLDQSGEPVFEQAFQKAKNRRSLVNFDLPVWLSGSHELFLHASVKRLQLYRTNRRVFLWLLRDITSLHNAELELNKKKEELEDFVYSVSHDLKSPIVSVQGYASLIKEDLYKKFDTNQKHYFDRIFSNINLMQKMIQDLLDFSRVGRLDDQYIVQSISEIVKESINESHYQIEKKDIRIKLPKRFPRVRCQQKGMKLVFSNLLSNAIKFMGDQKQPIIEIGWSKKSRHYEFFLQDNGIGISKNDQKRIFNIFYRSQDIDNVEGTGIGLTKAKKIIENHGGDIWVESEKGKGATFFFTLQKEPGSKK